MINDFYKKSIWCWRRFTLTFVILQWILLSSRNAVAKRYSMRELCDVQDGSVRISLDQGSYVQLDLVVDLQGPGTTCDIIVHTTHRGDGLLLYYENFDFGGSNFATVFRRPDDNCGTTLLKAWDGELQYLSTCIGNGLQKAPPMTTFSSLGAVRLQLLPTNMTSEQRTKPTATSNSSSPIQFSVIATASRKTVTTNECPSGCCNQPYAFRCPLLDQCIDIKLTCNKITNCGPSVGSPKDENGMLCNKTRGPHVNGTQFRYILGPTDVRRVITESQDESNNVPNVKVKNPSVKANDVLLPIWSHPVIEKRVGGSTQDKKGITPEARQIFYSKVELVCGIVSIALFCLAGIAVLACKSRQTTSFGSSTSVSATTNTLRSSHVVASYCMGSGYVAQMISRPSLANQINRADVERTIVQSETTNENCQNRTTSGIISFENDVGPHFTVTRTVVGPKPVQPFSHCCSMIANGSLDATNCRHGHCSSCSEHPPPSYETLYPK